MSTIDIACAADAGYLPHAGAMLCSLFAANPQQRFRVHFLHREGPLDLERIDVLCRAHDADLRGVPVPSAMLEGIAGTDRYPEEAWYRIVLPDLLPQCGRLLWLDSDTIVLAPIQPLWELDLRGRPLAAVPNALGPRHADHLRRLGMHGPARDYFNTGVMLLDLYEFRRRGLSRRLREERVRQAVNRFADQDVFGPVLAGDFVALPLYWNVMAGAYLHAHDAAAIHGIAVYREALRHPRIVHFTQHKPWRFPSSHPYRDHYLRFRREAGWEAPVHGSQPLRSRLARRMPFLLRAWLTARDQVTLRDLATRVRASWGAA